MARVSLSLTLLLASVHAMRRVLATVRETGRASGYADQVADFKELQRFVGMDEVLSLERRFLPGEELARKYGDAA